MDKRIKHSIERIKSAMIKRLQVTTIDKITVKEICEEADINRSTFYAHFKGPEELYNEIETDMLNGINDYILGLRENRYTGREMFLKVLSFFKEHSDWYNTLVKVDSISFHNSCISYCEKRHIVREDDPVKRRYYEEFYISGIFALVNNWLKNGRNDDINLVTDAIMKLIERKI